MPTYHQKVVYQHQTLCTIQDMQVSSRVLAGSLQASVRPRLLLSGQQEGPVAHLHQAILQTIGDEPMIIHRAGSGKWFPYCGDNASTQRCWPEWVSPPLLDFQAGKVWDNRPHGLTQQQADVMLHKKRCCLSASHPACHGSDKDSSKMLEAVRRTNVLDVHATWNLCEFGNAAWQIPVPLMPIDHAGHRVMQALNASWTAFQHIHRLSMLAQSAGHS
jgi:hypothetical protein